MTRSTTATSSVVCAPHNRRRRAATSSPSNTSSSPIPHRRAVVGDWYRRAFDRYEATLPESAEFRETRRGVMGTHTGRQPPSRRSLAEAPVIVLFLQARIRWESERRRRSARHRTARCVRLSGCTELLRGGSFARARHDPHDRDPCLRRRRARGARRAVGQVRDCRTRSCGSPDGRVRHCAAQAGTGGDPLERMGD